jgi:RNA polymerase sigma-70 factor (ECF subfamily)
MGYFREVELGSSFPPFATFLDDFGFVPNVFRAQTLLPGLIEAEAALLSAIVLKEQVLPRIQKEYVALTLAQANRNTYCVTAHHQMLRLLGVPEKQLDRILVDYAQAGLTSADTALLGFTLKLGANGPFVSREDATGTLAHGWTDESMLEAILTTAWTNFLCTLSTGVGAVPEFTPRQIPEAGPTPLLGRPSSENGSGPYLKAIERNTADFPPFAFFVDEFGFVPNVFRAQTSRPEVLEAEASALRTVLLTGDVLTRLQKEYILLAVSAANLNTYWVAVYSEMLRMSGVTAEDSDQIATDHRQARLPEADKALLDFALRLAVQPSRFGRPDIDAIRRHGFTEEQVLEAVVMTALTNFLNTLQMGLGATPDFASRRVFRPDPAKIAHLSANDLRPSLGEGPADPDAEVVAKVRNGDVDAFEELINRHSRRVYRTLVGILGSVDEARDAMQDTFLKAFQHLGDFQQRAKFSTWLVSIASNTGLQRLRERRHVESLDDDGSASEEGFRPREVRAWTDDPEQLCSKTEIRALVENTVMKLPAKYRVVLVLRDLEQLSIEETAGALGLGIPALKARHLRGRLMVREALSPHFSAGATGVTV